MPSLSIWIVIVCVGLALVYLYTTKYIQAERLRQRQRYDSQLQDAERSYRHQLLEAESRYKTLEENCRQLEHLRDDLQQTISEIQSRYSQALDRQNQAIATIREPSAVQPPSTVQPEVQDLEAVIARLRQDVAQLEHQQCHLRQEIEDEQLHKRLIQDETQGLERINADLRQEQKELREENERLIDRHYQLMEQEEMVEKCRTLEQEKTSLEIQLDNLQNQLRTCTETMQRQSTCEQNLRRMTLVSRALGSSQDMQDLFQVRINTNFDTVIQAVEFAEYLNHDVLEIWDSARQSAYESNFLRPHDVYLNLQTLAYFGRDYFAKSGKLGMSVYQALTHLQCDYVAGESTAVQNNEKLFNQRLFRHGNVRKTMLEHVRVGTGTGGDRNLRIYFALNGETQKVEIGHCGRHLDTQSS